MSWYIGIDQSYTGFAVVGYLPSTGEKMDSLKKFPGKGISRLCAIEDWLTDLLMGLGSKQPIEHICIEGYANGMKFGREAAGELGAAVKRTLYDSFTTDVRFPTICPPTSVKKFATGKGTAKKQEMLLAVYKKWGVEYHDDNLADAYVLARMAAQLCGLSGTSIGPRGGKVNKALAYESEALAKLTPFTERV